MRSSPSGALTPTPGKAESGSTHGVPRLLRLASHRHQVDAVPVHTSRRATAAGERSSLHGVSTRHLMQETPWHEQGWRSKKGGRGHACFPCRLGGCAPGESPQWKQPHHQTARGHSPSSPVEVHVSDFQQKCRRTLYQTRKTHTFFLVSGILSFRLVFGGPRLDIRCMRMFVGLARTRGMRCLNNGFF